MGKYSGLSDDQIDSKLKTAGNLVKSGYTEFGIGAGYLIANHKEKSFIILGIIAVVMGLGVAIGFDIKHDNLLKEKDFRLTLTKQ